MTFPFYVLALLVGSAWFPAEVGSRFAELTILGIGWMLMQRFFGGKRPKG